MKKVFEKIFYKDHKVSSLRSVTNAAAIEVCEEQ